MFGGVNVWRIAEVKEIGEIQFGKLIDFIHKDAAKFWLVKVWRTSDDSPTFPPPNIPAIWYFVANSTNYLNTRGF